MSRLSRRASALLGALAVAGAALAVAAPAASAHAALLFTAPAAASAVPAPPEQIVLTFDEPVTLAGPPVVLTNAAGHRFAVGGPRQSGGRAVVTVPVAGRLPDGVYTVAWQAVSADGDPVSAAFTFAVGPAPASLSAASTAPPATPGQWWLAGARWVLFAALAMAPPVLGRGATAGGGGRGGVPRPPAEHRRRGRRAADLGAPAARRAMGRHAVLHGACRHRLARGPGRGTRPDPPVRQGGGLAVRPGHRDRGGLRPGAGAAGRPVHHRLRAGPGDQGRAGRRGRRAGADRAAVAAAHAAAGRRAGAGD